METERYVKEIVKWFKFWGSILIGLILLLLLGAGITSCVKHENTTNYPRIDITTSMDGNRISIVNGGTKFLDYYRDGDNIVLRFERVEDDKRRSN